MRRWIDGAQTPLPLAAFAVVVLGSACVVAGWSTGPRAGLATATAVAGTAVYRQLTGGCWASCQAGWVCDPKAGFCVKPSEERPPQRLVRVTASRAASPSYPLDAGVGDAAPFRE